MLSAMPCAILPKVLAVQGAISIASAHSPRLTWLCHDPSRWLKNSETTGLCVKALSVMGVMNSLPAGVITTCTSAPCFMSKRMSVHALYAAILPVMPRTIFLPFSIVRVQCVEYRTYREYLYFKRVRTCFVFMVKSLCIIQL